MDLNGDLVKPFRSLKNKEHFIWGFGSTLSASICTFFNLWIFREHPKATEFVHLFSCVAVSSAVLNNYLFFGGNFRGVRSLTMQGFIAWLMGVVFTLLAVKALFGQKLGTYQVGFVFSYFLPVFFAAYYREGFKRKNFAAVYGRTILLNFLILTASVAAFAIGQPELIYFTVSLVLLPALSVYALDPFFKSLSTASQREEARAIANPAWPLLERTLFDQLALQWADLAAFTWLYYFSSRIISFTGTVFFTVSTERTLSKAWQGARGKWPASWAVLSLLVFVVMLTPFREDLRVVVILGQLCTWLTCNWLIALHSDEGSKAYWAVLALAGVDSLFRWATTLSGLYRPSFSSWICASMLALCLGQLALVFRARRANGQAQPE